MAITQQDIIEAIPKIIKENEFERLLSLRQLAYRGWGDSKLHTLLDELVGLAMPTGNYKYLFNSQALSYKQLICVRCHDSKTVKHSYRNKWVDIPCPHCTINASDNAA